MSKVYTPLKYAMYMSFTRDIQLYEIYTMIGQNSDGTQLCTVCHSQFILTITVHKYCVPLNSLN